MVRINIIVIVSLLITASTAAQSPAFKRVTSVNDSYPSLSPDGTTLLFQSDRSGDVEIWSVHSDGSNLVRITSSPGYDGNPAWSPDGRTIAFTSTRDGNLEIYTMKPDGSAQTRVTQAPGNDGHPHWYPDGSRIIFNSARTTRDFKSGDIYDEIFSMRPDGTDVKQITNLKSVSTYACVSPDGSKIVYRGSADGPAYAWDMTFNKNIRNSEIFVSGVDGSNAINVSQSPAFDGWPSWSPDSKKVIFASNRSGKPNSGQLYTVDVDGSNLSQLTDLPGAVAQPFWSNDGKYVFGYQLWESAEEQYGHIVQLTIDSYEQKVNVKDKPRHATSAIDCYPVLSPDGLTLLFHSNRDGDWDIYAADANGNHLRQLTNSPAADAGPVWSPDGKKIAFVSERDEDTEIYIMNADGSNQTRLTKSPGDDSHPHWYPDGSRIVFNSARNTPDVKIDWALQQHEVHSIKPDGTDVRRITDFKTVSTYPSVSPDGKNIVFRRVTDGMATNWDLTSNKRNRNSEVFTMTADGKDAVNLSNHTAYDGWPAYAPDGKTIVFVSNRNGKGLGGQLFLVNTDGGELRQLTDLAGAIVQPSWAPDGKSIVAYQCFETEDWEFGSVIRIEVIK